MTFNKWFPYRPETRARGLPPLARAWMLRGAWYVSLAMLVVGYILVFLFFDA